MRAKRTQLQKREAFEAGTDDRILFLVGRAFIPQAAVSLQQLRVFSREAIKTRTAKSVLAFDDEAKRDRKFSKRLWIRFDCGKTRDEIAFTIRRAARVQLAVRDRGGERSGSPFRQLGHRLNIVMTVNNKTLWTTTTHH